MYAHYQGRLSEGRQFKVLQSSETCWQVEDLTGEKFDVQLEIDGDRCTCGQQYEYQVVCKHILAVLLTTDKNHIDHFWEPLKPPACRAFSNESLRPLNIRGLTVDASITAPSSLTREAAIAQNGTARGSIRQRNESVGTAGRWATIT